MSKLDGSDLDRQVFADRVVNEKLNRAETIAARQASCTVQGKSSPAKPKVKTKIATSRKYKGLGGLVITAERSKGLDPIALVESLRAFADQVETETPQ